MGYQEVKLDINFSWGSSHKGHPVDGVLVGAGSLWVGGRGKKSGGQ
jgi:hypothetical protein